MKTLDMLSLEGKVALVTGAGSPIGIGAAVAEGFAEAGANVVIADLRVPEDIAKGIAERTGKETLALQVDISDEASVEKMVNDAIAKFGHIDVLVNNAGISVKGKVSTPYMDLNTQWDKVIDVNLNGAVRVTKYVSRHMIENGIQGSIINTSSQSGVRCKGPEGGHSYSATKAGIIMLTRCWALEFAGYGIRVNAVAPGFFHTDITEVWRQSEAGQDWLISKVPMYEMPMTTELKGAYLYLASQASSFTTGQTLLVDGGTEASLIYEKSWEKAPYVR